jgi:protein involved in polysaccharide export with SLBB domain
LSSREEELMESVQNALFSDEERVEWGRLVPVGLLAALVAAVANAVVYLVAASAGAMPQEIVVNGQGPITLPVVAALSAQGAVAATIVYALVGRFARRPVRVFRVVAAVVLVLSLVPPFTITGAPISMILALELMHVIAAVVIVGLLTTMARRAKPAGA